MECLKTALPFVHDGRTNIHHRPIGRGNGIPFYSSSSLALTPNGLSWPYHIEHDGEGAGGTGPILATPYLSDLLVGGLATLLGIPPPRMTYPYSLRNHRP